MTQRPMSDRHHDPADTDHPFEVRLAEPAVEDRVTWRTVAYAADYENAARVAGALVSSAGEHEAFAEVWGPGQDERAHRGVIARFPQPTKEEQQQMWLEAADQHYSGAYSDLPH